MNKKILSLCSLILIVAIGVIFGLMKDNIIIGLGCAVLIWGYVKIFIWGVKKSKKN